MDKVKLQEAACAKFGAAARATCDQKLPFLQNVAELPKFQTLVNFALDTVAAQRREIGGNSSAISAIKMLGVLSNVATELDPTHATSYAANVSAAITDLLQLGADASAVKAVQQSVSTISRKVAVVVTELYEKMVSLTATAIDVLNSTPSGSDYSKPCKTLLIRIEAIGLDSVIMTFDGMMRSRLFELCPDMKEHVSNYRNHKVIAAQLCAIVTAMDAIVAEKKKPKSDVDHLITLLKNLDDASYGVKNKMPVPPMLLRSVEQFVEKHPIRGEAMPLYESALSYAKVAVFFALTTWGHSKHWPRSECNSCFRQKRLIEIKDCKYEHVAWHVFARDPPNAVSQTPAHPNCNRVIAFVVYDSQTVIVVVRIVWQINCTPAGCEQDAWYVESGD